MSVEVKLTAGEPLSVYLKDELYGIYTFRYIDDDNNAILVKYPCSFEDSDEKMDTNKSLQSFDGTLSSSDILYIEKESGEGFRTFAKYFLGNDGAMCI